MHKKKFVGTWVDNMNPSMSVMEGDYDADKQEMVMRFLGRDPASGAEVEMKSVTVGEADQRHFTMYAKDNGKWGKAFEIKYNGRQ